MNVRIDRRAGLLVALALMSTISVFGAFAGTTRADQAVQAGGTPAASLCAVLAAGSTGAMPAGTPGHGMRGGMMGGTPAAGDHGHGAMMDPGEFDLMFIDMMIPHHESAVVMAQIALERSAREEIRGLAREIIATQSAEIALLREWRDHWYPGAPEMPMAMMNERMMGMMAGMPHMPGMGHGMMAGMDMAAEAIALCTAPEPFDLAFIDAMIPHHESAVAMANVGLEHSTREEMIAFHQAVIDAQQREIDQMRAWRDAWFGPATPEA